MLRSLTSAVSGLLNFQQRMDVIGNNVANVNTLAFKSSRTDFADSFSETLQSSAAGSATSAGTPAMQIGSGVTTAAIRTIDAPGALVGTERSADLAINGNGYFMVRDAITDRQYATRAGNFNTDENGYLVTNSGYRVQGYADGGLTTLGDIRIDATGKPATASADAGLDVFSVSSDGKIVVTLSDGTQFIRGQILLQNFSNPQALMREGNNLYSGIVAAGPLGGAGTPASAAPGTNGLGSILEKHLEISNVDLAKEFADLITTQRGFQASARIITTSDEMLMETVNLKR